MWFLLICKYNTTTNKLELSLIITNRRTAETKGFLQCLTLDTNCLLASNLDEIGF